MLYLPVNLNTCMDNTEKYNYQLWHYRWLPIDPSFMEFLWVPNVFIYNLDTFDAMYALQKLSGLWIIKKQELFYNQVGLMGLDQVGK